MLAEHEQRFARIISDYLARPGGDYGELLHRGQVSSPDGVDPEAWRAEIRAQARRDKIRVITSRDGERAIAALNRAVDDQEVRSVTPTELGRSLRYGQPLRGGWRQLARLMRLPATAGKSGLLGSRGMLVQKTGLSGGRH